MSAKRKNFICEVCGENTSSTFPNYYKQKKKYGINRCKKCGAEESSKSIKEIHLNKLTNSKVVEVKCPICGQYRNITYRSKKNNLICISCSSKIARDTYKEKYDQLSKNRIDDDDFKKSIVSGIMKIDEQIRINNAKKACSYWKNDKLKNKILLKRNTEEYKNKLKEVWKRDGYRSKMSKIASDRAKKLWENNEYKLKMSKIRSQQLKNNRSKQHVKLNSLLDDLGIKYINEYVIGPWSFDCFIPENNILIEVQGDYWHSLPKAIRLDKSKSTYINKYYNKYKIVYFYEHEFYQNNAVIERLKYELGINKFNIIDFDFDEVSIKIIDSKDTNDFMYKYHYIGPVNHSLNIGFFLNDTLISCCCFSPISRNETSTRLNLDSSKIRELSRFAIHPKYQKKNFASWCISKCINYIKNNKNWEMIISFSDTTVGHYGTIYKASNFILDGKTEPSYYYISNTGYVMHKKTLYNRAVKMSMTEKEFSKKYEYKKLKTAEKYRFIYKINR